MYVDYLKMLNFMKIAKHLFLLLTIALCLCLTNLSAEGLNDDNLLTAEGSKLDGAKGHFKRAHGLLIAAIREFDKGTSLASPEYIINIEAWRADVQDRADDLNIILSPQPRISKEGVNYEENIKIFDNRR